MPISQGTRLGPYVVQESIGQGAMGIVYRAYHAQLERTGAVKVLQALSPDEETTARFRREAQAIAHMRHPNVLNVFDFGDYEGVPYMIVEYVEGGSLAGRIKRSGLTPAQALHYLRGIGSALDYAHSLGIVHRDVKPANVLLGSNDAPILADFGLAKLMQSSSIKSATGVTTGTPAYMAPEQVTGGQVGPAADRYSLAVMAFEMLTGTLPFDEAGVLEVLYAHVHREPPRPSTLNPALNPRVDGVLLQGMSKAPEARWSSCEAFVEALEAALQAEAPAMIVPRIPVPPPQPVAAGAVAATVAVAPPAVKKRRRGLWPALGAAALIAVVLLVTIGLLYANRPTLQLSVSSVPAGGYVTVTAAHVPKGQDGTIQLHSSVQVYPFKADSNGHVSRVIEIPIDTPVGQHEVDICWNGTCHASQPLTVVSGVAQIVSSASPGSSPTGTPNPSPTRAASPGPSPTPVCSTGSPSLTESPNPVVGGARVTIRGADFSPGPVTLQYYAAGKQVSITSTAASSACALTPTQITTKVALGTRADKVVATDRLGRSQTVSFTAIV